MVGLLENFCSLFIGLGVEAAADRGLDRFGVGTGAFPIFEAADESRLCSEVVGKHPVIARKNGNCAVQASASVFFGADVGDEGLGCENFCCLVIKEHVHRCRGDLLKREFRIVDVAGYIVDVLHVHFHLHESLLGRVFKWAAVTSGCDTQYR